MKETGPQLQEASRVSSVSRSRLIAGLVSIVLLAGCASTAVDDNFDSAQAVAKDRLGAEVKWLTTNDERLRAQQQVEELLRQPLSVDDAVRISLAYSPALQAMLFEGAASSAAATQLARLPNPIFTFERLVRNEGGERELEIGRALGISLFDIFLLPTRMRLADFRQQQTRLRLTGDVVQTAITARQSWVRAVAAQQSLKYFEQNARDSTAPFARPDVGRSPPASPLAHPSAH